MYIGNKPNDINLPSRTKTTRQECPCKHYLHGSYMNEQQNMLENQCIATNISICIFISSSNSFASMNMQSHLSFGDTTLLIDIRGIPGKFLKNQKYFVGNSFVELCLDHIRRRGRETREQRIPSKLLVVQ